MNGITDEQIEFVVERRKAYEKKKGLLFQDREKVEKNKNRSIKI